MLESRSPFDESTKCSQMNFGRFSNGAGWKAQSQQKSAEWGRALMSKTNVWVLSEFPNFLIAARLGRPRNKCLSNLQKGAESKSDRLKAHSHTNHPDRHPLPFSANC